MAIKTKIPQRWLNGCSEISSGIIIFSLELSWYLPIASANLF
jgi:hypothetical protein